MVFKFNIKSLGKKHPYIGDVKIELDVPTSTTLKILLKKIVQHQVKQFNERKENRNLLTYFHEDKVSEQTQSGSITFNERYDNKVADPEKAVDVVWQAYEDGLIAFFFNDERIENIEQNIQLDESDSFTIIKLTFLSGGIF